MGEISQQFKPVEDLNAVTRVWKTEMSLLTAPSA